MTEDPLEAGAAYLGAGALGLAVLAEAKAFARVDGGADDAVIGGMVAAACGVCEAFVGQMLIVREVSERVPARGAWTRLARTPVRSVTTVVEVAADGGEAALPLQAYAIDIDGNGDGWVRAVGSGGGTYRALALATSGFGGTRLRVTYHAGIASNWAGVPDALRQGVLRLAAHLYARQNADGYAGGDGLESPPAAVAALWRPYRRMRLL